MYDPKALIIIRKWRAESEPIAKLDGAFQAGDLLALVEILEGYRQGVLDDLKPSQFSTMIEREIEPGDVNSLLAELRSVRFNRQT